MTGLGEEMNRLAAALPFAAVQLLVDMGVPVPTVAGLTGAGMLGLSAVDLLKGGRFALGGPGRRLILGVRDGAGEVTDLVALSSRNEDEWALVTGEAAMLGEDQLEHAIAVEQRELRLHATPMGWLRAGCAGVCVLDWGRTALSALRGLRPCQTIVTDAGAGPKLEKLLAFGGLPLVAEDRRLAPVRRAA